jgi:phospholipase C
VRGFADRTAPLLPNGSPVWYQPTNASNADSYMLPWHVDSQRTSASCMRAPEMDWPTDIAMWNGGRMNAWNTARYPGFGMSYFTRDDLPYYYALADGFTIGDAYHQSTFTQTNPNRLFLFSGSNGVSAGFPAVLDNHEPNPGFNWTTAAEVLENKNVSWRVFQQLDNFDDNGFAWFSAFQSAKPGSAFFDKGLIPCIDLELALDRACAADSLPTVSWFIAPTALSEHATNHPAAGEDLSARLISVLKKYPEVYKKTAL